jgi:phage terminase large subunit-like protein
MKTDRAATRLTIADMMRSPKLLGASFAGPSWHRWQSALKAAYAEPMDDDEIAAFREVAGRDPPKHRVKEFVAVVGRGGGKDATASLIATHAAASFDPKGKLRPGEKAVVMCLACDRAQAAIVFGYIRAYFEEVPALKKMVQAITAESIELSNRVVIEVHTNSYRSVRGRSLLCAIIRGGRPLEG